MIYKTDLALAFPGSGKNDLQNQTSLSYFWAREKFAYKTDLTLTFLGSGKIRLQNEFFLLYYPKQRFLMSSCEVTKAQIYINF